MAAGEMLGEITHATAWWVGDWWIYGEHRYGERKVIVEADNRIGPRRKTETHAATAWPSSRSITASHLPAANAADVLACGRRRGFHSARLLAAVKMYRAQPLVVARPTGGIGTRPEAAWRENHTGWCRGSSRLTNRHSL
jgi:hypothetical protein